MMQKIEQLFDRVNSLYERGKDTKGLKATFRLIIETILVEFCMLRNVVNA